MRIPPLPDEVRPVYNVLRGLIRRGVPISEMRAAWQHIENEEAAKWATRRLKELGKKRGKRK